MVRKLLTADRAKRLGNLRAGGDDVRKHKWFRGLDFTALFLRQLEAPFVPETKDDKDTRQFETYPASPPAGGHAPTRSSHTRAQKMLEGGPPSAQTLIAAHTFTLERSP